MTVQKRRKYSSQFKQDAVKLVAEQGYKVTEAARNLGINDGMLRRWIKQAAGEQQGDSHSQAPLTQEQARIWEVRRGKPAPENGAGNPKKSNGLFCKRIELRFDFIRREKEAYPVAVLCRVMGVSRSGFYRYLKALEGPPPDIHAELEATIKDIFESSQGTYGSRRMSNALRALGHNIGRHQARSLMRKLELRVRPTRRFKVTTNSRHNYPLAPNRLNRQFDVNVPDTVWATDITYLWTQEGWLHLAVVIDLFSRKVVGWAIDKRMTTALVVDALTMAVWRRRPPKGLLHHSDRGSQYASHAYQAELRKHGMVCSMSRKGDGWDNSVIERFFRSLKTERTNHRLYRTREEARQDAIDYIAMFYNSRRLHSYLGYLSPDAYEAKAKLKAA